MEFSGPTEEEWLGSLPPAQQVEHLRQKPQESEEESARLLNSWRREDYDRIDNLDDEIRHLNKRIKELENAHGA